MANPAWNAVRQQIPSISPLVSLTGVWVGDGPLRPDSPGRWDYGPHAIAVTIDAVGSEPQDVEARRTKRRGAAEIVEVKMAWDDGVLATVRIGNAGSEKQRQIFIQGTQGTLEYDDISETKARKNGKPLDYSAQLPLVAAVLNFARSIRVSDLSHESLDVGVAVVSTLARLDQAGGF